METKELEKKVKEEEKKEEEETLDEEVKENLKSFLETTSKDISSEMRKEIKADLEKWMEEQKEAQAKKVGIYNEDVKDSRKVLNDKFKKTVEAIYTNDVDSLQKLGGYASRKEMTTDGTGTPYGGYAVDSELSAEIRHLVTEYGVARREMSVLQLSKNSYDANSLATDVSVFWTDEGSQIDSTQVVLGQDSLELKKLGAIVTITSELLQDEEVDLFSFISGRVAEGFAKAEDEAFFKGDGTSTYGSFTGILEADDVNTTTLDDTGFGNITAEKLLDMQTDTPQGAQANAKYYMHRSILNEIRKLRADAVNAADSAGSFLFQAPGESQPVLLWNKPIVLVEAMPSISDTASDTGFVIYGDLRRGCILGNKGAIAAKRFDAGVVRNVADSADINLITSDREAIRWTQRVGYIRIIPTAMTVLKTADDS
ncbi:MAG: phage major capsid protein [Elusimicrobiota bacterium]